MKSYAVLNAPEFRLQAVLRHQSKDAHKAVALLVMDGTKPKVAELTRPALESRVERGMTATQATARCPDLLLVPPNPGHERSAQEILLQAGERLSPFLESTGPGIVTVELAPDRGPREDDLAEKIVVPARSLGLDVRVGVAGTPDLALLAARHAEPVLIVRDAAQFLAPLEVGCLQPNAGLAGVLDSWGVQTVGQLVRLPAGPTWERLGPEAVRLWEMGNGGRARPLALIKPRESFGEASDLEHPVEMLEPLLFLVRRFLEQICLRLAGAYLVAGKLRFGLRFEASAPYERIFTIPQPTRDPGILFRILHTHLEDFRADSAIVAVELAARPVSPGAKQPDLLDRGLRNPQQFTETLGRLQALLGTDEVGSPELEASHHPEAFRVCPYDPDAPVPHGDELLIGVPWMRFHPAVFASVVVEKRRPIHLRSARSTGPIREARGPWRASGEWWEAFWAREEWDIATSDGLFRLVLAGGKWFLDGIYA